MGQAVQGVGSEDDDERNDERDAPLLELLRTVASDDLTVAHAAKAQLLFALTAGIRRRIERDERERVDRHSDALNEELRSILRQHDVQEGDHPSLMGAVGVDWKIATGDDPNSRGPAKSPRK